MGQYIQVDFTDTEGTAYKIEIHDDTYTGTIFQVQGKATLDYPKVKTMDMLRGSSLKMQLEASVADTYQQRLYETVGDKKLPVYLYRDGSIFWNGFIKPDGIVESFVSDYWIISVQAIDGLGYLENIKFLDSSGNAYQGAVSELEILARCLELTGQTIDFRIYDHNLYFSVADVDPTLSQKAIVYTYVNTDRYVKEDKDSSVFTAKEVLESILKKYGAFVTQYNNKWNVVRIIEYYTTATTTDYKEYTIAGVQNASGSANQQQVLGSQINGFDPFHAGGNQQRSYNASLGAYKVFYEYGLVISILENHKIEFNDGVGDVDGWIVEAALGDYSFVDIGDYFECRMKPDGANVDTLALSFDTATYASQVDESDAIKVDIPFFVNIDFNTFFVTQFRQKIQITLIGDSGDVYYLNDSGEWTLTVADIYLYNFSGEVYYDPYIIRSSKVIEANICPESGDIDVQIYFPGYAFAGGADLGSYSVIKSINISGVDLNVKGESHTAVRNLLGAGTATTVIDTEDKLYVGDNNGDLYIGAIEDSAGENITLWSKAPGGTIDATKQWKILNWMVRDRLTISSGNATIFRGQIYGFLPYLGILTIDNVETEETPNIFMTIKWSYDLAKNVISAEHERIFQEDIYSDIDYSFALEGDNIIRPAIE